MVALAALARDAVVAFSAMAEQRRVDLGLTQSERLATLGDPHALRTLLDNLIDNALRYAPPGAWVDVSLTAHADHAVLRVSDNGPGIAHADRHHVLQRFVRLDPSGQSGSGLGLAIVQDIARLHGATLDLSDTPGGGLCVTVTLPLCSEPSAELPSAPPGHAQTRRSQPL